MTLLVIKNRFKILIKKVLRALANKGRSSKFFSQNGQDEFLENHIFGNFSHGYFVDIGANDGVTYSNTYFFEKRGWQGLCVEPIPEVFAKLVARRNCECVCGVISGTNDAYADLLHVSGYSEMLSGVVGAYEAAHSARVEKELQDYGGKKEVLKVKNYNFNDLVHRRDIDYLSIDVEGSEFEIIKSIDFALYTIKVISVENPYNNVPLHTYLQSKGFVYWETVGADDIFIYKDYEHLKR